MTWIEDDSDVIDVIESAKTEWFESHPECDVPTSEKTDEEINSSLGLPAGGALRPLADEFADWSAQEIRNAVSRGLENWYNAVDILTVEHYDQLSVQERKEYRGNTLELSRGTKREFDAIDRGEKAPCLS